MGKACTGLSRCLLMVNLKSPVLWPPDPLVPAFAGDQPSESSQQVHARSQGLFVGPGVTFYSSVFRTDRDIEGGKSVATAPQGGVNQQTVDTVGHTHVKQELPLHNSARLAVQEEVTL